MSHSITIHPDSPPSSSSVPSAGDSVSKFTPIYNIPMDSSSSGVVHTSLDVTRPPTDAELRGGEGRGGKSEGGVKEDDAFRLGEVGSEEGR